MRKKLTPVHPGVILLEDFLKPMGVSQYWVATAIGVPPRRINEIVHGKRAITADTALRLSRYFGMSEAFWMNLQAHYDLESQKDLLGIASRERSSHWRRQDDNLEGVVPGTYRNALNYALPSILRSKRDAARTKEYLGSNVRKERPAGQPP